MRFDPFESRLCRDIRNRLGHAFVLALQAKDIRPFTEAADPYPADTTPWPIRDYIRHRQTCLTGLIENFHARQLKPEHEGVISLLLWNLELFYEFHEWMEIQWQSASGLNKKAFQALILCAVTHEHFLYGRKIPAQKAAAKALVLLNEYRDALPKGFDADLLIQTISDPDPLPPKFSVPV
ncbi:MAG: DUF309 domain-containing protein [Desulfobacula sp.]|nr:DUF309 domain-containing protein [Desulfobacula sp.]